MADYIEPFNFQEIFIEYFLGKQELFVFAFTIVLSYVAAKYQMSNKVFLILLSIGGVMFGAYIGEAMYFLILVVIGLITFKSTSKLMT